LGVEFRLYVWFFLSRKRGGWRGMLGGGGGGGKWIFWDLMAIFLDTFYGPQTSYKAHLVQKNQPFLEKTEPFWPKTGPAAPRRKPLSRSTYLGWVGGAGTDPRSFWGKNRVLFHRKIHRTKIGVELHGQIWSWSWHFFYYIYLHSTYMKFWSQKQTFIRQISVYWGQITFFRSVSFP